MKTLPSTRTRAHAVDAAQVVMSPGEDAIRSAPVCQQHEAAVP